MIDAAPIVATLVARTKEFVAEELATRRPDGDIYPQAIFITADCGLSVLLIDGAYLKDGETKDNLVARLCLEAARCKAVASVLIFTAWLRHEQLGTNARGSIAGEPGAVEVVGMQEIGPAGISMHFARIERTPGQPPRLGPWDTNDAGSAPVGRFLRLVRVHEVNRSIAKN